MSQFKQQCFFVDDTGKEIPIHIFREQKRLAEAEAMAKKIENKSDSSISAAPTLSPKAWFLYKWLRKRLWSTRRAIALREICKNAAPIYLREKAVVMDCLQQLTRAGLVRFSHRRVTYENHEATAAFEIV